MVVKKAGLDSYDKGHIHQLPPAPTHANFGSNSRSIKIKNIFSYIDDHENHLILHENNQKLRDGKPHSFAFDEKSIKD